MKVLSTEGLIKLIELVKSAFISVDDTVSTNFVTLATVATTGDYDDLTNKPTIPAAQVQANWNETDTSSKAYIQNKPTIPSGVIVDQTYDGTSTNAQSGIAIEGAGFVKLDGGSTQQTIALSSGSGTTALGLKSGSTTSYLSFSSSRGWLGSYGVSSAKKPTFYNGTGYTLAYTSDIPTNVSSFTNDSGYITGIGSSDVTTALGYTPANTTLSNLGATSSTNFDGQWVQSRLQISTATAVGSIEHNLATYLPNDNYIYEVYFSIGGSTSSGSSGGSCGLIVGTVASPETNACLCGVVLVTKTSTHGRNTFTLPIDTNRKVYSQIITHDFSTAYVTVLGYRRIGTNT